MSVKPPLFLFKPPTPSAEPLPSRPPAALFRAKAAPAGASRLLQDEHPPRVAGPVRPGLPIRPIQAEKAERSLSLAPIRPAPVKRPPPTLLDRVLDVLLADWWIDVLLMIFIVGSMLFLHQ